LDDYCRQIYCGIFRASAHIGTHVKCQWLRAATYTVSFLGIAYFSFFCVAQTTSHTARAKSSASSSAPTPEDSFAPVQQWKNALASQNAAALRALYSSNPPARIFTPAGEINADGEVAFWTGLKSRKVVVHIAQSASPGPGTQQLLLNIEVRASTEKEVTYTEAQIWQQQNEQWRLVAAKRAEPTRLEQPASTSKNIYAAGADAHAEIKEALQKAKSENKRVIVVFGANWCYDCHVLDLAFHRNDIARVLNGNYEVVHVDIGEGEKNQDLMQAYEVPMKKGIPALAVLEADGKLLYSQKNGEFEKARALGPEDLLAFLNKWKPHPR